MTSKDDPRWTHCNECGRETKHTLVHTARSSRSYTNQGGRSIDVGSAWSIFQCRGCDEVVMSRFDWCSKELQETGESRTTYFPPRVSRRKPDWFERYETPKEYAGLLEEVYAALHADSRRLAVMGVRTLIDLSIIRSVGDHGDFEKGLKALANSNHLSERDVEVIKAAIDVGHASAHRGHQPSSEDVNIVMDIVERLIHAEILAEKAKAVKANTPSRPPRNTKKTT
jgi:hypothetical protein